MKAGSRGEIATPASLTDADALDCGPPGVWAPSESDLTKGPVGVWDLEEPEEMLPHDASDADPSDITAADLDWQMSSLPGDWAANNDFNEENEWSSSTPGSESSRHPCPCRWMQNKFHLDRCNWWHCGPPKKGGGTGLEIFRLKSGQEYISDFQANVNIGGKKLWVTLDTGLAVTWVMSAACFMDGCKKVPMFGGMFIP